MTARAPSIVITYPYPIGQRAAGGSRTTREIARHLAMAGAEVVVMPVSTNALSRTFPRARPDERDLGREHDAVLAEHGVEVVRVPQSPLLDQLDGLPVKRAMRRLLRTRRVDFVLGHYYEAAFLPAMLRARGIRFGMLASWQTYADLAWKPARLRGWARKAFELRTAIRPHRVADVVFAISEFTRGELIDIMAVDPDRIVVCPLGVEPTFLEVPRARPARITRLLFFGRIMRSKGFEDAIDALGRLARKGSTGWTYRMLGAGRPEWARAAAEEHGVADRVAVLDAVDDRGLARELEQAHLAVLPSHAESFGHAMVEAQAAGIPVVAYRVGSVPEVVQDGVTGWLAPFRDVGRLAELIERAIADPEGTHRAGLRARERVRATYSWSKTAATILDWLRDATASQRPSDA